MHGLAFLEYPGAGTAERPLLVSYPLCPFVQRVAIALEMKAVRYRINWIDLADPPDWFRVTSPLGKVPLLMTEGTTLFESGAIIEYIDEVHAPRLHPRIPEQRARERSWMEVGDAALWDIFELSVAPDLERFDACLERLHERLDRIERSVTAAPFFRGAGFGLVDATWAPLFQRMDYLDRICPGVISPERHPRAVAWKSALLSHPAVERSHVPDLESRYRDQLARRQGYVATQSGLHGKRNARDSHPY